MKDPVTNVITAMVSSAFTLVVMAKGLDCIIDAKQPCDILKGCIVTFIASCIANWTYKVIKDKDI